MSAPNFTCPRCHRTTYNPTDVEQGYCGGCHDWTRPKPGTLPVRFLVYVDAELREEAVASIDPSGPDEATWLFLQTLATHQGRVCAEAEARGSVYLVDVEFWDGEHVRWGTDADGMVIPLEVGLHDLAQAINARWT